MDRPSVLIKNVTTGEVIIREMDNNEFAQYLLDQEIQEANLNTNDKSSTEL
jgi:hypothetical protein